MIKPRPSAREVVADYLSAHGSKVKLGFSFNKNLPWRAHVYEPAIKRAWYCHDFLPESDGWLARLREIKTRAPHVDIGISGPVSVMMDEKVLLGADELNACVLPLLNREEDESNVIQGIKVSASDFVFEDGLRLSPQGARSILDRNLRRAIAEANPQRKGVLLEVVTAVMLSQVRGYEVISRGISNRTQQIDVGVHNRNSAGVLRTGELVLAEAKNWAQPVGVDQYALLVRKLETRFGRSKLGFFVTTDRMASTVALDKLRDSRSETLVVTLDGTSLPKIWRDTHNDITKMIEAAIMSAAFI